MDNYGGYSDNPLLADLYDFVPAYGKRRDVDFYVSHCRAADGPVLELGCGTGRILIPAARAGCEITGLDLSENMLSRCRQKLPAEEQVVRNRVHLVQGTMVDFHLDRRFHAAIIPFRGMQQIVAVEQQMSCLRSIHRHLIPGGKLLFDVFQLNVLLHEELHSGEEIENTPEFTLPDGRRLRRTHRLTASHRTEQYNNVELIYYVTDVDGTTERLVQSFPMRYYFRYELEHLLARCGFTILDLYGDFNRSPLQDDSPEMIFVAGQGSS